VAAARAQMTRKCCESRGDSELRTKSWNRPDLRWYQACSSEDVKNALTSGTGPGPDVNVGAVASNNL
jgi:hypothetical protein